MKTNHSELLWKLVAPVAGEAIMAYQHGTTIIINNKGEIICDNIKIETAAFIVTACNNFDKLVDTLQHCYVKSPGNPVLKGYIRTVLADIEKGGK